MSGEIATRTVALVTAREGWGCGLVASLPRSLRLARDGEVAQVVLVDGASGWTDRARTVVAGGAARVAVVEPVVDEPADVAALAEAVERGGVDFALFEALPDNPALAGLCDRLADGLDEVVIDGEAAALEVVLFAQVRLLRALGFEGLRLESAGVSTHAFILDGDGRLGGSLLRLRLTGVMGAAPARMALTVHGAAAAVRLEWQDGAEARPVEIAIADAAGLLRLPAIHEGGHRHALRSWLHERGARADGSVLQGFADDLVLARSLLGSP